MEEIIEECLPVEIKAVVYSDADADKSSANGEADTEDDASETVITLDGWTSGGYPETDSVTGRLTEAPTGSYIFTASLPDGCSLGDGVPELIVRVDFGSVMLLSDSGGVITDLMLDSDGKPTVASGTGWSYDSFKGLTISEGYILDLTNQSLSCSVTNYGTISGGTFSESVTNYGAISGGTFYGSVYIDNSNVLYPGTINGGTFNGDVTNAGGVINGGTFSKEITIRNGGIINDGTFNGIVDNEYGRINKGTFNNKVILGDGNGSVCGEIFDGNFKEDVIVYDGYIYGGNFDKVPQNSSKEILYKITIVNGTGQIYANAGESVSSIYAKIPDGNIFTGWTSAGVTVEDENNENASFTMPSDAVTVTANYETGWPIKINGQNILARNKDDVLKDGGSVSYDPDSNTLYLNNASIMATGNYGIETTDYDLNIELTGTNTVTSDSGNAVYVAGNLKISGSGSLTAKNTGTLGNGIWVDKGDFDIEEAGVTAESSEDDGYGVYLMDNYIKVSAGGKLTGIGSYTGIEAMEIIVNAGAKVEAKSKGDAEDSKAIFPWNCITVNDGGEVSAESEYGCGIYGGQLIVEKGGSVSAQGRIGICNSKISYNGGTLIANSSDAGMAAMVEEEYDDAGNPMYIPSEPVINASDYDWRLTGSGAYTIGSTKAFEMGDSSYAELREHDWGYSLESTDSENDTITAKCRNRHSNGENVAASVVITAPEGDLTCDGTEKAAAVSSFSWTDYGFDIPSISYTKDGAAYSGVPKEAGTYTASITAGGKTAGVSFVIAKAGSEDSGSGTGSSGSRETNRNSTSRQTIYADGTSDSTAAAAPDGRLGHWRFNGTGWWFEWSDGSWPYSGWQQLSWNGVTYWYHFDADGYLSSGFFTDTDGNTYYLYNVHDGNFGYMYTGWNIVNGSYRYFMPESTADMPMGAMLRDTVTPDGYRVGPDGAWTE